MFFAPIFQHEYFYDKTVRDEFIRVNICLTITNLPLATGLTFGVSKRVFAVIGH